MKIRRYVMYLSILIALVTILWPSKYDRIMKPILEMKEKNPNLIVDGKPEPPFPDKKKNIESITGIDVNKNGIRDDLEIYANRVSKTELERKVRYRQYIALENLVRAVESKNIEFIRNADGIFLSRSQCVYDVLKLQKTDDSDAFKDYDSEIEIFEVLPRNKNIREKVSIIRAGEAGLPNIEELKLCSQLKGKINE